MWPNDEQFAMHATLGKILQSRHKWHVERKNDDIQWLRRPLTRLVGVFALVLALCAAAYPAMERVFLQRASDAGETTLRIAVEGLTGTLDRFEPLPKLIAERPILLDLLNDPRNEGLRPFVNEQLRLTAMSLGVSDVYLMDLGGTTIAASSYRKELSFVGRNFAYRPYFQQAVEGGLGRYFALGTTSGERGYFFASPVLDNTRVRGVVAIKFAVDAFEDAWRGGPTEIIVTDLAGVVFMASRPDWHFRTLAPLASADFTRIAQNRQYPLERLLPLDMRTRTTGDLERIDIDGEAFVANHVFVNSVGWRVTHLAPVQPARAQAIVSLALLALLLVIGYLAGRVLMDRRERARERLEVQQAANESLERQVAHRTEALNAANARLMNEIEERKATERQLRQTQRELIQAGKLAALGQMSAALSHEINQPLTAVKAYAENAGTFLARNRIADAAENVARISKMADRMSALSGHLRNFARRPQETVETVDLAEIVQDALDLMEVRLKKAGARVGLDGLDRPLWVRGGRVRLQQVIVNLISNALDAMDGMARPEIRISASRENRQRTELSVSDRGAGLSDEVLGQIFDPFFTTKGPNMGLGLGLSISYNIVEDFGGSIRAANREDGGAVFTVSLETAHPDAAETTVAAQ